MNNNNLFDQPKFKSLKTKNAWKKVLNVINSKPEKGRMKVTSIAFF